MVSDQIVVLNRTATASPRTWGTPIARRQVTAISSALHRMAIGVRDWARIPALPYAALWEASLIAGFARERDSYAPDPCATEMPFLAEPWPRG
jgi:hypothetical protein